MTQQLLVVPSMSNNLLTVLDLNAHAVLRHVPLPKRGPSTAFASPDGDKMYALASGGNDVVVMDTHTWTVDRVIPVKGTIIDRGKLPAAGRNFWTAVIPQGHIHQVDTDSGRVLRSFEKAGPCFTVNADETLLFTLDQDKRKKPGHFRVWSVASGELLAETATPPLQGFTLGMWTDGANVYWCELAKAGAVHVMDVSEAAAPKYRTRVPVGSAPLAISIHPDGTMWVPNSADGTVSVIDTQTQKVIHTLDVSHYVGSISYIDGRVYLVQTTKHARVSFWKSMWITIPAPYLGVYITKKSGAPKTRRFLDIPAEVVAYDAITYERLPWPAMTLPSIGFSGAVIARDQSGGTG
ncbi:MAG: WD40 repeat domain-containing protein [Actinomycetota bacterium]|nr:WD40 repeat domain-containing protein [Actinomycetota bacterium]